MSLQLITEKSVVTAFISVAVFHSSGCYLDVSLHNGNFADSMFSEKLAAYGKIISSYRHPCLPVTAKGTTLDATGMTLAALYYFYDMSHVMTKPAFAICKQKGADQPAHPRSLISAFVFRCLDSIIPLLATAEISKP